MKTDVIVTMDIACLDFTSVFQLYDQFYYESPDIISVNWLACSSKKHFNTLLPICDKTLIRVTDFEFSTVLYSQIVQPSSLDILIIIIDTFFVRIVTQ